MYIHGWYMVSTNATCTAHLLFTYVYKGLMTMTRSIDEMMTLYGFVSQTLDHMLNFVKMINALD